MDITPDDLAELVQVLEGIDFTYFQVEQGDMRITITRGALPDAASDNQSSSAAGVNVSQSASAAAPILSQSSASKPAQDAADTPTAVPSQAQTFETEGNAEVRAPMMGTVYLAPKPGAVPFVRIGDEVAPDTVVAIIEVMKLMTPVQAGVRGVLTAVCCKNDELVDFDQVLFRVHEA